MTQTCTHPIADAVRRHALARPNAPALTAKTRSGAVRTLSYGELQRTVKAASSVLARREPPLAIAPRNQLEDVIGILAAAELNAPLLILDPFAPERRTAKLEAFVRSAMGRAGDLLPRAAYLVFTSGSTSVEKCVAQPGQAIVANAEALIARLSLEFDDTLLTPLTLSHVNALHLGLHTTIIAGAHLHLLDAASPPALLAALSAARPRVVSVTPSLLLSLCDYTEQRGLAQALPSGMTVVTAAAALSSRTAGRARELLGVRVTQGYGLSETTNFSTMMSPTLTDAEWDRLYTATGTPPVGATLDGVFLRLNAPADGRPDVREVEIRGPHLSLGYHGNEAATADAFTADGWFRTGDLGRLLQFDGRDLLVLEGRTKNIIKVGGHAVSLDELTAMAEDHPHVQQACAVCLPDRTLGEVPAVLYVGADGARKSLRETFSANLPPFAIPRWIVATSELPRTRSGKPDRAAMIELLRSLLQHADQTLE